MNNKEKISIFALKFNKICEMNRSHIFGYLLGLLIFVIGIAIDFFPIFGWSDC